MADAIGQSGPPKGDDLCNRLCSQGLHRCKEIPGHNYACPPCDTPVQRRLHCGHISDYYCNELDHFKRMECTVRVMKVRRCGHHQRAMCGDSLDMIEYYPCRESVKTDMECGHGVVFTNCWEGPPIGFHCRVVIAPQRSCGHPGPVLCGDGVGNPKTIPPCKLPCLKNCIRGHPCSGLCGEPCPPCLHRITGLCFKAQPYL